MAASAGIFARESRVLDRYVQIGLAQGRVLSVTFPNEPDPEAGDDHEILDRIESYLDGERETFEDVTVAMTMPTHQREVLEAVTQIPYGESASLDQLTRMVPDRDPDEEDDRRAVREALAENPTPLLIPTHRVRGGPETAPADVEATLRSIEGL